jgi:hypothetical protein
VSADVIVAASLLRSSTVPDSSCRATRSKRVEAVDTYFFFFAFAIGFLPIFLAIFFASALPLAV